MELPRVEPLVLLPVAAGAPMALVPLDGAPIAVLPGVVGPDMLPVPAVVPAPAAELELLPYAVGPLLPMLPLLLGVVVLLLAAVGSQGMAPGAGPVVELEVCAKAKPFAASMAASRLDANVLIVTPS